MITDVEDHSAGGHSSHDTLLLGPHFPAGPSLGRPGHVRPHRGQHRIGRGASTFPPSSLSQLITSSQQNQTATIIDFVLPIAGSAIDFNTNGLANLTAGPAAFVTLAGNVPLVLASVVAGIKVLGPSSLRYAARKERRLQKYGEIARLNEKDSRGGSIV